MTEGQEPKAAPEQDTVQERGSAEIPPENRPNWEGRGVQTPETVAPLPPLPEEAYPLRYRPERMPRFEDVPDRPDFRQGFHAEDVFSDLKYDFRPQIDAYGIIDEPNEKRLDEWQRFELDLAKEANEITKTKTVDDDGNIIVEGVERVLATNKEMRRRMRDALVRLCNGSPDQKALYALKPLTFARFYTYVRATLGES